MRVKIHKVTYVLLALGLLLAVMNLRCGSSAESDGIIDGDMDADHNNPSVDGDSESSYWEYESAAESDMAESTPEPEDELKTMSRPVIGNRYVFVLNILARTVVAIESGTLKIKSFKVGEDPRFVTTIPGRDVALVLCAGSDEMVMLDMEQDRNYSWDLATRNYAGYNDIVISDDGMFATLFFNHLKMEDGDRLGALQEVAIMDLSRSASYTETKQPFTVRSVGLNPIGVFYTSDSATAYIITDYGLTAIDLTLATYPVVPNISLEEGGGDSLNREVLITPSGDYALVRRIESSEVNLVDLSTGQRKSLTLEGAPTDMDLSPDGRTLYVVLREQGKLGLAPLPGGFEDPAQNLWLDLTRGEGQVVVSPDGRLLLAFTNVELREELTIIDLSDNRQTVRYLSKSVRDVVLSPTGSRALVLHTKLPGSPESAVDIHQRIDRSYGYSVVNLANEAVVLTLSDAQQEQWVFTPDESKLYLMVTDETRVKQVHIVDLSDPFSAFVGVVNLGSLPSDIGIMPGAGRTFVSQAHTEGRITFFDWNDDDMITVTGFELNSNIQ